MAHISLQNLSLSYPVLHGSARSLKKTLFARARASLGSTKSKVGGALQNGVSGLEVLALKDITFDVEGGERLGLVGHNGAGKTTLLRVLGGIYETSSGSLSVEGETHAMINPGSGMNQELTGRENVHLFARRLQLDVKETEALEADVEAFAELGTFFDLPLRLYSAGMSVRLGFALATVPRPQILLMDEWFMAGDSNFQAKARVRLESMVETAEILVFTSHSLDILREWCTRVLWLEAGKIVMDGKPDAVLDAYETFVAESG